MQVHANLTIEVTLKLVMLTTRTNLRRLVEPSRVVMETTVVTKWPNPQTVVWTERSCIERRIAFSGLFVVRARVYIASAVPGRVFPDIVVTKVGVSVGRQGTGVVSLGCHVEVCDGDERWQRSRSRSGESCGDQGEESNAFHCGRF